jgi:hypothetical protein
MLPVVALHDARTREASTRSSRLNTEMVSSRTISSLAIVLSTTMVYSLTMNALAVDASDFPRQALGDVQPSSVVVDADVIFEQVEETNVQSYDIVKVDEPILADSETENQMILDYAALEAALEDESSSDVWDETILFDFSQTKFPRRAGMFFANDDVASMPSTWYYASNPIGLKNLNAVDGTSGWEVTWAISPNWIDVYDDFCNIMALGLAISIFVLIGLFCCLEEDDDECKRCKRCKRCDGTRTAAPNEILVRYVNDSQLPEFMAIKAAYDHANHGLVTFGGDEVKPTKCCV